jgi:hypothetical protein
MTSEGSNARWQDLVAIREELDGAGDVVVPHRVSRIDGKPLRLSPKAARFARALAVSDSWSRISDARNRRLAA